MDEDDELLSEYSPSELSDIIHNEENDIEGVPRDEDSDESEEDFVEEDSMTLSLEQRQEQALDDMNIRVEMLVPGDATNFPVNNLSYRASRSHH